MLSQTLLITTSIHDCVGSSNVILFNVNTERLKHILLGHLVPKRELFLITFVFLLLLCVPSRWHQYYYANFLVSKSQAPAEKNNVHLSITVIVPDVNCWAKLNCDARGRFRQWHIPSGNTRWERQGKWKTLCWKFLLLLICKIQPNSFFSSEIAVFELKK